MRHGRRVVCPWHHAVFDLKTGRHLEPPGCDHLKRYQVRVAGDEVWVALDVEPGREVRAVCRAAGRQARPMVIVGTGAAAAAAALALRQEGYEGHVVVLGEEAELPYDRTLLSKEILQGADTPSPLRLRSDEHWADLGSSSG